jgi:hypothetical protein
MEKICASYDLFIRLLNWAAPMGYSTQMGWYKGIDNPQVNGQTYDLGSIMTYPSWDFAKVQNPTFGDYPLVAWKVPGEHARIRRSRRRMRSVSCLRGGSRMKTLISLGRLIRGVMAGR